MGGPRLPVLACSAVAGGVGCGLRWCSRRTSKTGGTWLSTSAGTATRPARKHQARELPAASPACKRTGGQCLCRNGTSYSQCCCCPSAIIPTWEPMLLLPVCHRLKMDTKGVRSKYSDQCQMRCMYYPCLLDCCCCDATTKNFYGVRCSIDSHY